MPRAAIDIGSNSLLLTIADDTGSILHDEARLVGLGRGLGNRGLFAADRIAAADAVLADYLRIARTHGIAPNQVAAVATSAARRAMNARTWVDRVAAQHGLQIRVISGEEEARLTWRGALHALSVPPGEILVVDLGGGSTELVLGTINGDGSAQVAQRTSLELGSARLTEEFFGTGTTGPKQLAALRAFIDTALSRSFDMSPRTLIGVAGTVTTLATMRLGLRTYDASAVHGSRLTRADLARFIDQLLPATPEQRRAMVPSAPDRADFMLAGATVIERVLRTARRQQLIVSDRGLRYGLLAGGVP